MSVESKQKLYYGWVVVAVSFITMAIVSPAWFSFSIFYPSLLAEFGWSRGATAGAYSLNLLINAILSPFAGTLLDRFGPRRVMPIGAFVLALGFIGAGQIHKLWHFYLWFGAVAAFGFCAVQVVPNAAIVSNWFLRNRATAIGIIMGGIGIGRLILFPLIQYSISRIGWRLSYIALGGLIIFIVAPLILIFQRHKPSDKGLQDHPEVSASTLAAESLNVSRRELVIVDPEWAANEWTLKNAAKTYRFWGLALLFAVYSGGVFLITVQVVAYLVASGFSSIVAASVIGLQGLLSSSGNFIGGWLSDRIGREKSMTLSIAIFAAGLFILSLVESYPSLWLLYGYVVFFGLGFGMAFPAVMASAADLFQGKHYWAVFGAINLIGGVGGALGAWLGGFLYDKTGNYRVLFAVTISAIVFSTVFIWSARPSAVRMVRRSAKPAPALS